MWWLLILAVALALVVVARHFIRSGGSLWGLPYAGLRRDSMRGRTVVVTGGTSGIGFEVVHGIAQCGARVIMACVTMQEGEAAKERLLKRCSTHQLEVFAMDLRDPSSIRAFAAKMIRIDAFVNCAGVCGDVTTMLHVNFLGPALLLLQLHPHLTEDARVVFVGSDAHQIGHVDVEDFWLQKRFAGVNPAISTIVPIQRAYGTTKLMLILWMKAFSCRTPAAKRLYAVVQPGFVNTPMGEEAVVRGSLGHLAVRFFKCVFAKSAWQGAQTVLHVASEPNLPADPVVRPWANNAHWQFWNPQIESVELQQLVWDKAQERWQLDASLRH